MLQGALTTWVARLTMYAVARRNKLRVRGEGFENDLVTLAALCNKVPSNVTSQNVFID